MMEKVTNLFREIEQAISEQFTRGERLMRGAEVAEVNYYSDLPLLVVYGYQHDSQIEVTPINLQQELEVVRAGLPALGVREVLTYVCREGCYFMIVAPEEPLDMGTDDMDAPILSEDGFVQLQVLVKRLSDLSWHAWAVTHDVALPGLRPSRGINPDDLFSSLN